MKHIIITLLLFLILTAIILPQELIWKHLGGPMGGCIGDMVINSKGHIYAGVYTNVFTSQTYEGIYRSTDNGETWQKLETNVDQFEVYAIYINRYDHIFVGTNYRHRVYRSVNDGESWQIINNGYETYECWAIGENKDGTVMFAGDGQFGQLYRSISYGNYWELSASLPVLCFAVDSSNNVYCGTFNGLYKSTDDGLSWNETGLMDIPVNKIIIDDDSIPICGTGYYDSGDGIFYSTDYGETWESMGLKGKVILSLAFTSNKTLMAGSLIEGVYSTTDMGITWIQHNNGLFSKQAFRLGINKNDDIFIGSEYEGVFRSTNNGESFEHKGLPISEIYNIDFLDDSLIIAATVSGVQKYNKLTSNWKNIGLHAVLAVETDTNGNIYAGTNGSGLFVSSNVGEEWTNICQSPIIHNIKKVNETLLAATDTGLIRSTNNGISWEDTPVKSGIDNCAIETNNNGDIWATGYVGKLYKSTDGGINFTSFDFDFHLVQINSMYVKNSNIFFSYVSIPNGISYSTNYGNSWKSIIYPQGILSLSGSDNYIILSSLQNILFSYNEGITWDSISYPLNFYGWVNEIEFDKYGKMYFGTSSQGLYESDLLVSVEEIYSISNEFFIYPLYPNPFNSLVNVKYNVIKDSKINIKIYNILGEEVKSINIFRTKGINQEMISFDNLPGGIYLIAIEGKDFFAVRKAAYIK